MSYKSVSFRMVRLVALTGATAVFLMFTNPATLPSFFLVVPFIGMFLCLYFANLEIIRFFRSDTDETVAGLQIHRPRLLAALAAAFPVLLLVLQSLMRLTLWDICIVLVIFLLGYIYIARSSVTFHR